MPFEPKPLPLELAAEIRRTAEGATAHHREVLVSKMEDAVAAYDRGRYAEASRLAGSLALELPTVPAVRELAGLAAYRAGRWRYAVRHLEAFAALGDDLEHVPALMDTYRALHRRPRWPTLWTELRQRSPDPEVLAEARMVAAGFLADQGDLDGAISLLATAGAGRALRNPSNRHLRQWYALADLYERAGDLPRAREFFIRVAQVDPDAYDVAARLGRGTRGRRRPRPPRRPRNAPQRMPYAEGPHRGSHRQPVGSAWPSTPAAARRRSRLPPRPRGQGVPGRGAGPPGPDFLDRVFRDSDRPPAVLRNLGTLYSHGRLGGTGYLSILPVDQGIEHSAAASFAKNPAYFDPANLCELALAGECSAIATTLGTLGAVSRRYVHRIPFIVKLNHNDFLHYPNTYDQVPVRLGAAGRRPRGGGRGGHHLLRLRAVRPPAARGVRGLRRGPPAGACSPCCGATCATRPSRPTRPTTTSQPT